MLSEVRHTAPNMFPLSRDCTSHAHQDRPTMREVLEITSSKCFHNHLKSKDIEHHMWVYTWPIRTEYKWMQYKEYKGAEDTENI